MNEIFENKILQILGYYKLNIQALIFDIKLSSRSVSIANPTSFLINIYYTFWLYFCFIGQYSNIKLIKAAYYGRFELKLSVNEQVEFDIVKIMSPTIDIGNIIVSNFT